MNENHPGDGQFVVTQGGKRISGLKPSQQEAQAEADRVNQLRESQGQAAKTAPPAEVKQNLLG